MTVQERVYASAIALKAEENKKYVKKLGIVVENKYNYKREKVKGGGKHER